MERFEKWPLLASVDSPEALKCLPESRLGELAGEIRDYLTFRVGQNGGHLSSNLGVVELTMAIHRVFDTPGDHVIFDVGHQSYTHKLLTGRGERFDTLRTAGGISGFPKRAESEHDAFGTGHSSTAISAAVGMAEADALAGRECWTVAVVGDGALTGGLAYEGLNNVRNDLRLIIIINENEMSISPNTGRLAGQLSRMRASRSYLRIKEIASAVLRKIPLIGKPIHKILRRFKRHVKHWFYRENRFEYMGIRYMGPIDGNDTVGVETLLRRAKRRNSAVILHLKTTKGKGYAPAEADAAAYHSVAPAAKQGGAQGFSHIMGGELCRLAEQNERICAITAAMCDGTGLAEFAHRYPKRFFDVGIAEGHAVTFAAGLAAGGYHPVVAVYSSFLQRAVDNLLHDTALQNFPLTLCIDRAGFNAPDGPTHHGVFDVALLSTLSDVRIFTPVTKQGLIRSLALAQKAPGITAIRYPSGEPCREIADAFYATDECEAPGVRVWESGPSPKLTVITHGRIAAKALLAANALVHKGIELRILLCEYIAPYGELADALLPFICGEGVLTLEEEIRHGGFGMNLQDALLQRGLDLPIEIMAAESGFVNPASGETPLAAAGLDAAHIEKTLCRMVQKKENEYVKG